MRPKGSRKNEAGKFVCYVEDKEPEFVRWTPDAMRRGHANDIDTATGAADMAILDALTPAEYDRVSRMSDAAFCEWMQERNEINALKPYYGHGARRSR